MASSIEEVKATVRRIRYGVTTAQVEALTLIDDAGEVLEELRACGVVQRVGNLWLLAATLRVVVIGRGSDLASYGIPIQEFEGLQSEL